MSEHWPRVTLGDVLELSSGKSIAPGGDGSFPVYGSNGLIGRSQDFLYRRGIVIGRVGAYCGSVALSLEPFWASDNTIVARPKGDALDLRFAYYLLLDGRLNRWAGGAAQPLLTQTVLKPLELHIPSPQIQRRIASILGAYDELIEVNRRRVAVLQAMAQRLFDEWFTGTTCSDWVRLPLGTVVSFEKGKKAATVTETLSAGHIPQLLIEVLRGSAPKYVQPKGMVMARPDDTLMVMDGSGSSEVFIGHAGAVGSTLGRYRCIPSAGLSPFWLFLLLAAKRIELRQNNTGAAVPHANKNYISQLEFAYPPPAHSRQFHGQVKPMFGLIGNLSLASARLSASRDLLLPRLISGDLCVATAERELEAVA